MSIDQGDMGTGTHPEPDTSVPSKLFGGTLKEILAHMEEFAKKWDREISIIEKMRQGSEARERKRERKIIATASLQGLLGNEEVMVGLSDALRGKPPADLKAQLADSAVGFADALIAELDKP